MGSVNMKKHNQQAYILGNRAADMWKNLKRLLVCLERRCAAWAKKHNAPVWVSRIPLIAVILISLTGLIAGGFVVALIAVFIWAIAYILQNIEFSNMPLSESSYDTKSNTHDDFIVNSTINNEYDGAPYKSPSED
jgi:hypothetical protein